MIKKEAYLWLAIATLCASSLRQSYEIGTLKSRVKKLEKTIQADQASKDVTSEKGSSIYLTQQGLDRVKKVSLGPQNL